MKFSFFILIQLMKSYVNYTTLIYKLPRNQLQVIIRVIKVFQLLMQHSRPEKIVGKKFVRGKPYFKVKWQGAGKEKSTWETPARLKQFKSMVNKYEAKNWGTTLDQKYFDPRFYEGKRAATSKTHDKKKVKKAKTNEKRKVEEQESGSYESQPNQNNSEDQQRQPLQKKVEKQEAIAFQLASKKQTKDLIMQVIDLDEHAIQPSSNVGTISNQTNIKQERTEIVKNKNFEPEFPVTNYSAAKIIEGEKIEEKKLEITNQTQLRPVVGKDLGLTLIDLDEASKYKKPSNLPSKKLTFSNAVYLEIEPAKIINRIAHIYHLEKVNLGNHLYLVQFNDKQMQKMTTKDLLEKYPDTFVNYLESKYRAKCSV